MDQAVQTVLVLAVGWLGFFLLWKIALRGAAVTILLFGVLIHLGMTMVNLNAGIASASIYWAATLTIWFMRIVIFPKYSSINPTFETNQIIRGLSPTEAGFFAGLAPKELLIITILHLADKRIIKLQGKGFQTIELNPNFQKTDKILSTEGRYKNRNQTARKMNQILLSYEHTLIELFPIDGAVQLSDLDWEIWFQDFSSRLKKFAQGYDHDRTKDYAEKITYKMACPESNDPELKRNISGWLAVRYFSQQTSEINNHRPEWLRPGGDFSELLVNWKKFLSGS
jgi:hypothetical protein